MKNHLNLWTTRCFVFCWGCLLALSVQAHGFEVGELFVRHPYAPPSLAGSQNGAVYFKGIQNKGKSADQLLSARTEVAQSVQMHEMRMDNQVMRMKELPSIELPASRQFNRRQFFHAHHLVVHAHFVHLHRLRHLGSCAEQLISALALVLNAFEIHRPVLRACQRRRRIRMAYKQFTHFKAVGLNRQRQQAPPAENKASGCPKVEMVFHGGFFQCYQCVHFSSANTVRPG